MTNQPEVQTAVAPPASDAVGEAERLNNDGTDALRRANLEEARRLFKLAHDLVRNPRYAFNEALAYEAAESDEEALNWLQIASNEHPDNRLMDKIRRRRAVIQKHKGSDTK